VARDEAGTGLPRAAYGRGGGWSDVARRRRGSGEEEQAGQSRRSAHQRLQLSRPAVGVQAPRTIDGVGRVGAARPAPAVGRAAPNALCFNDGLVRTFSVFHSPPTKQQQRIRVEQTRERKLMAKLNINGSIRDVEVEADTPLLWVIREQIGLTGTKYGCGVAQCGACSVHINDEVQRSCSIRVGDVKAGDRIVTIEGLSATRSHPVQRAWAAIDVPQCGYCQSGQIMAAAALLKRTPKPTD